MAGWPGRDKLGPTPAERGDSRLSNIREKRWSNVECVSGFVHALVMVMVCVCVCVCVWCDIKESIFVQWFHSLVNRAIKQL